jgi:hypothetical protein
VVVILHKVTNYLLKYKVFTDISAMMPQFVERQWTTDDADITGFSLINIILST